MSDRDLKLDSKYNIVSRVAQLERRVSELENELKKKMEQFNYVIARRWSKEETQLCCYTFHTTVFYGDMKNAKDTLEFIKSRADEKESDQYQIYKIDDEPLI
jgi:hypothetical protein